MAIRIIYSIFLSIVIFSCQKLELLEHANPQDNGGRPLVSTTKSDFITSTTAKLSGGVIDIGDAPVTEHGHCWSTNSIPTINDSKTSLGAIGVASFTSNSPNLTQNTIYYYRAYATNSIGTAYGEELSFTTNEDGEPLVITQGISNITSSSATLFGKIEDIGYTQLLSMVTVGQ
jgi:hypothetical protein